jgi:hypothetical protein
LGPHYVASQQVRLYADPGSEVVVGFLVNRSQYGNYDAFLDVSVSGYLVPVEP